MNQQTTIDEDEIAKFREHAEEWWNKDGPLKTLHDINPLRLQFIQKMDNVERQHYFRCWVWWRYSF